VLLVGLTLVYLSFERVSQVTRTAASSFIEKVAQLGADHELPDAIKLVDASGLLSSVGCARRLGRAA
jgi:hypothetical protein